MLIAFDAFLYDELQTLSRSTQEYIRIFHLIWLTYNTSRTRITNASTRTETFTSRGKICSVFYLAIKRNENENGEYFLWGMGDSEKSYDSPRLP